MVFDVKGCAKFIWVGYSTKRHDSDTLGIIRQHMECDFHGGVVIADNHLPSSSKQIPHELCTERVWEEAQSKLRSIRRYCGQHLLETKLDIMSSTRQLEPVYRVHLAM